MRPIRIPIHDRIGPAWHAHWADPGHLRYLGISIEASNIHRKHTHSDHHSPSLVKTPQTLTFIVPSFVNVSPGKRVHWVLGIIGVTLIYGYGYNGQFIAF